MVVYCTIQTLITLVLVYVRQCVVTAGDVTAQTVFVFLRFHLFNMTSIECNWVFLICQNHYYNWGFLYVTIIAIGVFIILLHMWQALLLYVTSIATIRAL